MRKGWNWQFKGSFREFFPNPKFPEPDDHLEIPDRARRFFKAIGATAEETPFGEIRVFKEEFSEREIDRRINNLKRDMRHD